MACHPSIPSVPTRRRPRPRRAGQAQAWMLGPALGIGLIVAGGLMLARHMQVQPTVQEVSAEIQTAILQKATRDGFEDGARIGPWWLSAASYDPATGTFADFQVLTGDRMVAARSALLCVDPVADTIGFELTGVVFTRVPDPYRTVETTGSLIHQAERFTLGPVPWGGDIVEKP